MLGDRTLIENGEKVIEDILINLPALDKYFQMNTRE